MAIFTKEGNMLIGGIALTAIGAILALVFHPGVFAIIIFWIGIEMLRSL